MSEQTIQLGRVRTNISELVLSFVAMRLTTDPVFHMAELTSYVLSFVTVAPDSPRRVFADLAGRGEVSYQLLDRRLSKYRLLPRRYVQRDLF
jgi:hypothetical protein